MSNELRTYQIQKNAKANEIKKLDTSIKQLEAASTKAALAYSNATINFDFSYHDDKEAANNTGSTHVNSTKTVELEAIKNEALETFKQAKAKHKDEIEKRANALEEQKEIDKNIMTFESAGTTSVLRKLANVKTNEELVTFVTDLINKNTKNAG